MSSTNPVANAAAEKKADRCNKQPGALHKARIVLTSLTFTFLATFSVIFSAPGAQAHTSLTLSLPENGSIVETLPESVVLTFTDPLIEFGEEQVNSVTIRNPDLELVSLGDLVVNEDSISAPFADGQYAAGLYKVYFRVISKDGHPVSGFISFTTSQETTFSAGVIAQTPLVTSEEDSTNPEHGFFLHHRTHILYGVGVAVAIATWAFFLRSRRSKI
jgi:methionine-rich copper-binding protein CopC